MTNVTVTLFHNYAARTKREECVAPAELIETIKSTTASNKDALPWLKLARFGDNPSKNGCLRYNSNVTEITGLEGDYDGKVITMARATEILEEVGIEAIVYPSPSWALDKPRWRILCPFSRSLPPNERDRMMGRLEGSFRQSLGLTAVFADESWPLSQSFYFGYVTNGVSPPEPEYVEGTPINLLDKLDALQVTRPNGESSDKGDGTDHTSGPPEAPIADIAAALDIIPNDNLPWDGYGGWNYVGMATWRAAGGSKEGCAIFEDWSRKSEKFDADETRFTWEHYRHSPPNKLGFGALMHMVREIIPDWIAPSRRDTAEILRLARLSDIQYDREREAAAKQLGCRAQILDRLVKEARKHARRPTQLGPKRVASGGDVSLHDFYAYMPMHNYIYIPTRDPWPGSSVNSRIPPVPLRDATGQHILDDHGRPVTQKATEWLDEHRPVEQMTWAPGRPMLIRDQLTSEGGWIKHSGAACLNTYRPPLIILGDASQAERWINHVHRVYPDDAEHIILFLAHRVQHPEEKINHALVLGGKEGIGKDSLLEPAKRAVGPWNCREISPRDLFEPYNDFSKSVILRVNEARDLGEANRFQFYDHMKIYIAAPPEVLRVNEKHLRQYHAVNVCGVIITTNHKADGIYLSADDRRHYVAWSILAKEDFEQGYWDELWTYYDSGGDGHVAAYLTQLDLTGFNPKAPPFKTPAFWDIVNSSRSPEDAEMADVLDQLGNPDAVTLSDIISQAPPFEFRDWLQDRKNRTKIPHRLEACGYVPVRNKDAKDGLWKIKEKRQVIYVKATLSIREHLQAARERVETAPSTVDKKLCCEQAAKRTPININEVFNTNQDDHGTSG
jgi:hypothetical protein